MGRSSTNRSLPSVRKSAPAPVHHTPAPVPAVYQGPSIGQSIKDGIGLGIGSSLGSRLVTSIFGAPKVETVVTDLSQKKEPTPYEQCMKYNSNDHETCKAYLTQSQSSIQ